METKVWWKSKTIWVNGLAMIALVVQNATGQQFVLGVEEQAAIITVANLVLRAVTKEGLTTT
jgi:hypothetical protein